MQIIGIDYINNYTYTKVTRKSLLSNWKHTYRTVQVDRCPYGRVASCSATLSRVIQTGWPAIVVQVIASPC